MPPILPECDSIAEIMELDRKPCIGRDGAPLNKALLSSGIPARGLADRHHIGCTAAAALPPNLASQWASNGLALWARAFAEPQLSVLTAIQIV